MATVYAHIDQDSRKILRDDKVVGVKRNVGVDSITFVFPSTFDAIDLSTAEKKVFYTDSNGDTQEMLLTSMTTNEDGDYEVPWVIPSSLLENAIRTTFGVSLATANSSSVVTGRWTTADAVFKILDSVFDDSASEPVEEDDINRLTALVNQVLAAAEEIGEAKEVIENISGSTPTFVDTLAERTDQSKIYVVRADNHLYYYSPTISDWVDAGEYGSYEITTEFDQEGKAIESAAVGNKFAEVKNGWLGISGSKFLSDSVYGVTLINSANLVSPPDGTAEMVSYIIDRLNNNPDGIVAYSGSTECTMTVDTIEATGSYVISNDAIILDDEVALLDSASNSVIICIKTSNYWAIATADQIETYVTSNPFVIYATIEL